MGRSAAPVIHCFQPQNLSPACEPLRSRARHLRRSIKNPPFTGGKTAPLPRWKLRDEVRSVKTPERAGRGGMGGSSVGCPTADSSARKLAAALWHLQAADVGGDGRQSSGGRLGSEPNTRHRHFQNICDHDRTGLRSAVVDELASPTSSSNLEASLQKFEVSSMLPYFAMERATKWDAGCSKSIYDIYRNYGDEELHKDQPYATPAIAALQEELQQARSRIGELESERHLAKQKLDHVLRKMAEEKALRHTRENEKMRKILEAIEDDLSRERRNRKKMEILNSQLVNELAEAKLLAKQCLQEYEKERKAREIVEDVCDELAKGIGDDKAEAESLKRESMKIQEELDGERKMLQMAEVWREERVQMKLVDAKLMLEEKYAELMKLRADLDSFLRAHGGSNANDLVLKEAAMLKEAADSIKLHEIEFHYQSPASGDNFSVFDEFQPIKEANEREIKQCYEYSPESHASRIHTVSPETDIFLENPMDRLYGNEMVDGDEDAQDASCLETLMLAEGHDSCGRPEGNYPSVNGIHEESHASVSGTGSVAKRDDDKIDSEISEICSATARRSRKKASSLGKLWRSSCTSNGSVKKPRAELLPNGKVSNGRKLKGTPSPETNAGEIRPGSPIAGKQGSINPHISRGTKGCTNEWPRDSETRSSKAKLLDARTDNSKFQLRQALENKS